MSHPLITISRDLSRSVAPLRFQSPVHTVYNPLEYARIPHEAYLSAYGGLGARALLVGMNPGPFGMAQTGVPFGEVTLVRDWLGIRGAVGRPAPEHPRRPVTGFDCRRSEVSGRRLWSWARDRFGQPERFFRTFFVWNYCPLVFMEESGRNLTPDKLPREERATLFAECDRALAAVAGTLGIETVIGVGSFAQKQAESLFPGGRPRVGSILHPSPASPAANRGWVLLMERQLTTLGLELPME